MQHGRSQDVPLCAGEQTSIHLTPPRLQRRLWHSSSPHATRPGSQMSYKRGRSLRQHARGGRRQNRHGDRNETSLSQLLGIDCVPCSTAGSSAPVALVRQRALLQNEIAQRHAIRHGSGLHRTRTAQDPALQHAQHVWGWIDQHQHQDTMLCNPRPNSDLLCQRIACQHRNGARAQKSANSASTSLTGMA